MSNRRLTTIVAADVVGYSRLMHSDESGTRTAFSTIRQKIIEPKVAQYSGRIIKEMGDGLLFEFSSVVDAVTFATDLQGNLAQLATDKADGLSLVFRIGINIGDVIAEDDDLHGDGVNIAARLEAICKPGGICLSGSAYNQLSGKLDLSFEDLGEQKVKNIPDAIRAWSVIFDQKALALTTLVQKVSSPKSHTWFKSGRPMILAGIAVLLAIGGLFYVFQWRLDTIKRQSGSDLDASPSIAVMPFDNLDAGDERQYIVDGITTDIITDLSKFRRLFVISSNSSFVYKNKEVPAQQVATELGVRYVVGGSIQWGSERLRINVQLIDADESRTLWTERYDRSSEDLFDVQNEIIKRIVASLAFRVNAAEEKAAFKKETDNLKAYELYLRATYHYLNESEAGYRKATALLEQASEESPDFAKAKGYLAWMLRQGASWGWEKDKEAANKRAYNLALEALRLEPGDAFIHSVLGHQYLFRREYDKSEAAFARATELNPNDPDLLVDASQPLIYLGKPEEAVQLIDKAMQVSPHFPQWYHGIRGWALTEAGRYEEAVATLGKMHKPRSWVHRQLAVALVGLNRVDEARKEIEKMLVKQPDFKLPSLEQWAKDWPYKETHTLEIARKSLVIAGAPQ
ncbi:MAG: adenylate/guanylate cyclase domain-containing protein [Rhizobiaceae bacterium]